MFICPRCEQSLIRTTHPNGVYWICSTCTGRAATLPFLKKCIEPKIMDQVWRQARDQRMATNRRCPICRHAMTASVASSPTVDTVLDVCLSCTLLWFDTHEYEQLPQRPPPVKPDDTLPLKARQALAIEEARRIGEQQSIEADNAPREWWQYLPAALGMPVEQRAPALQSFPWMTVSLVGIISLVSILSFSNLKAIVHDYGMVPAEAMRMGGLTLLTSFFLHGGWLHLIGNMYFLWIFGDNVEDFLGVRRYLILIFLSTIVGDMLHIAGEPGAMSPCIGASGGISGVITFYALRFPQARLGFMLWGYGYRIWRHGSNYFTIPAYGTLILWIALQAFGVWQQVAGYSNVSALAHLGGAACGFGLWLIWKNR